MEKEHKAHFAAIRKDTDYLYLFYILLNRPAIRELRRLFKQRYSVKSREEIKDDSFTCYFSEVYVRENQPVESAWYYGDRMVGSDSLSYLLEKHSSTETSHQRHRSGRPEGWKCERCSHSNHPLLRTCEHCLIDHLSAVDLHVVFILHGYGGSPSDMNKVLDLLSFTYPHVKCVLIHKCYSNESKSLRYLANIVVEEMLSQLQLIQQEEKRPIGRVSFIAHSIGGLVFRIAMNDPRLSEFQKLYHLFFSLNVPHLGILFGNMKTDIGARLLSLIDKSIQIDEISLKDHKDLRKTLLYELAKNNGKRD